MDAPVDIHQWIDAALDNGDVVVVLAAGRQGIALCSDNDQQEICDTIVTFYNTIMDQREESVH